MEITKTFFEASFGQSQFLSTVSQSFIGGSIVVLVWVLERRTEKNLTIALKGLWLVLLSVVAHGISLILHYLVAGQMVALLPELMLFNPDAASLDDPTKKITFFEFGNQLGLLGYRDLLLSQTIAAGTGVLLLVVFAFRNIKLIGGLRSKTEG